MYHSLLDRDSVALTVKCKGKGKEKGMDREKIDVFVV